MRRLNLAKYRVSVVVVGPEGRTVTKEDDYDVKGSLVTILLAPALQLSGSELRRNGKIADKIEAATDEIALEDAEYVVLQDALDKVRGFGKNDRELVARVWGAETFDANTGA